MKSLIKKVALCGLAMTVLGVGSISQASNLSNLHEVNSFINNSVFKEKDCFIPTQTYFMSYMILHLPDFNLNNSVSSSIVDCVASKDQMANTLRSDNQLIKVSGKLYEYGEEFGGGIEKIKNNKKLVNNCVLPPLNAPSGTLKIFKEDGAITNYFLYNIKIGVSDLNEGVDLSNGIYIYSELDGVGDKDGLLIFNIRLRLIEG